MYIIRIAIHSSLAAINTDMNGRVCGALVQFGCCQHRYDIHISIGMNECDGHHLY